LIAIITADKTTARQKTLVCRKMVAVVERDSAEILG